MKVLFLSAALLVAGQAFAESVLPPRTLESLRRDLARDFPPERDIQAVIAAVEINQDGTVSAPGLAQQELDFLARVFAKMKYGPERRIHMVTLSFLRPVRYAVTSFVEANAEGLIRDIDRLKILEDATGRITTLSP